MIKNFDQFNSIYESTIKYVDFTKELHSLMSKCNSYNIELVKSLGGVVEFDKEKIINVYNEDYRSLRLVKIFAVRVKRDDRGAFGHRGSEYLIIETTDEKTIPITLEHVPESSLVDLSEILNDYWMDHK